jgi:CheY-like chemotaxis protein
VEKPFVLLADDNEATCTLITALLRHDFVVDVVSDGGEAVEKLKHRQYAAVVLDLLMPYLDGYAVLDFLKEERPDLLRRVIVVTASLSAAQMHRVRQYEIFGVIAKPFEVDVLQATVVEAAAGVTSPPLRIPLLSGGMIFLLQELLKRV